MCSYGWKVNTCLRDWRLSIVKDEACHTRSGYLWPLNQIRREDATIPPEPSCFFCLLRPVSRANPREDTIKHNEFADYVGQELRSI